MYKRAKALKRLKKVLVFSVCILLSLSALPLIPASANSVTVNLFDCEKAELYKNYIWHRYSDFIEVKPGDIICIGPCMTNQGFHIAAFADMKGEPSAYIDGNAMQKADTFKNGQVIYRWRVTAGIKYIRAANTSTSNKVYVITKNQPFNCREFCEYHKSRGVDCAPYVSAGFDNPTPAEEIKNLFDAESDIKGAYNNFGKLVSTDYITTDFIPVKSGDIIYFGQTNLMDNYQLMTFDESKKPIRGRIQADKCKVVDCSKAVPGWVVLSYEIPEGVSYISPSCPSQTADSFLLTKNQPFNIGILNEFFGFDMLNKVPSYDVDKNSPLSGKKVGFFGDSICSADIERNDPLHSKVRGWAGRIGVTNDMDFVNYGVSGASVSNCRGEKTIINQLKRAKGRKFDFVILHGGVNDAWDAAPVGKIDSEDLKTFAGGLRNVLTFAKENFPSAEFGYILNFKFTNAHSGKKLNSMAEYVNMTKAICEEYGIKYLDLYSDDKLTKDLRQGTPLFLYDTIHPTSAGYDLIYPKIEKFMIALMNNDFPDDVSQSESKPEASEIPEISKEQSTSPSNAQSQPDESIDKPEKSNGVIITVSVVAVIAAAVIIILIIKRKKK